MGIITKIWTAMRGHATEAGQTIVDANALTILDQEMRDADTELRRSKDSLAQVMAKHGDELLAQFGGVALFLQLRMGVLSGFFGFDLGAGRTHRRAAAG